jgi:hypothetical protein
MTFEDEDSFHAPIETNNTIDTPLSRSQEFAVGACMVFTGLFLIDIAANAAECLIATKQSVDWIVSLLL